MLHLFVACPFFIPLFYFFIVHESVNSIILSFTGSSVHVFIRLFSENPILKKQPPDTFLISDSCFIIFYPAAFFCCHVAFCLNFTVFAALPLLVCSFDSAKVKLICKISACQIYYFAVVANSIDLVITFYISLKWL